MEEQTSIFALDIGTRSVVGLILKEMNNTYEVIDLLSIEHTERSMVDGQIHDVQSVSKVITKVKEKLEEKHGPLTKVCVAAAGRALRTERATVTMDIKNRPYMQKEDILHLELSAVQQAQHILAAKYEDEISHHYYCVGYSVMHYRLDREEIGNLVDQQGNEASVEIIATFLPKIVVESLISALHRAGLEMDALTLEPIAAINVLVPTSMRRLNVALVDIGAGTSDIAITDSGTVIAYGMVPVAGDEITEAISDEFLLDFPLAEKAKRDLYKQESITIQDILGFETEVTKESVVCQISDSINKLAHSICQEILKLNKKPPKAVMLVGGGSLTPELPKRIANMLELPENRVAIRGIDAIQHLNLPEHVYQGPELVTPIGIAIAAKQSPVHYLTVYVNERPVRLFDMKQLTVGDCILAAGIKVNKLYGKPGMAIMIKLNDRDYTFPGEFGKSPVLTKNGVPCTLDSSVQNGDQLLVEKGDDGQTATIRIQDLIDDVPFKCISINGEKHIIKASIHRNNQPALSTDIIHDHDVLTYKFPQTLQDYLTISHNQELLTDIITFQIELNGKEILLNECSGVLLKDGKATTVSTLIEDGSQFVIQSASIPTVEQLAEIQKLSLISSIPVFFRGEKVELTTKKVEFMRNGQVLQETDIIHNGDSLQMVERKIDPFIFQDIFRFIDITIPTTGVGQFKLMRNEQEVTFHEQLAPGDQLDVVFT
ncbi:cell division protein FtsA [Bacillus suaedaesalsae]|uniref:Cell division protein FtsA n=1 Tax=Bacillus suaedaesalsae TaxID=2810349 RepID=A0ABS2DEH6_9BACI|nr:cell division protein FtsA [Bacillus suaedaesalsae]MBM6616410.1 cell division protein FtsA [Bacillus suaedaesalsae]